MTRDLRDSTKLGADLLALRRYAPKARLSALYDKHRRVLGTRCTLRKHFHHSPADAFCDCGQTVRTVSLTDWRQP